jgi:aryl-alcohol dehydrogenase-like predicted oxidoreductase
MLYRLLRQPFTSKVREFADDVRDGKFVVHAPAWWVAHANTLAQLRGWSPFVGLQIEYSLIERTVERELVPMAKALNLPIIGARKLSQLQDNLASFVERLYLFRRERDVEASQIDPGFQYSFYAKEHVRANAYGGMRDQIMA